MMVKIRNSGLGVTCGATPRILPTILSTTTQTLNVAPTVFSVGNNNVLLLASFICLNIHYLSLFHLSVMQVKNCH